jgi:hypothetical protein
VHNLVTAVQAEQQLDLPAACQMAADYADAEVRAFVAVEAKLCGSFAPLQGELDAYVTCLKHLTRGNLDWSRESGRYAAPARESTAPIGA